MTGLFSFITRILAEFLKIIGASVIWFYNYIKGNKKKFRNYVWEEELPVSKAGQISIGATFIILVSISISFIVRAINLL